MKLIASGSALKERVDTFNKWMLWLRKWRYQVTSCFYISIELRQKVSLAMHFITLNSRSLQKASHHSWNPLPLLLLVLPNIYIGSTIKSNSGNGYFNTVTYYCLDYSTSCSWQNNQADTLLLQRLLFVGRVQLQKMQNNLLSIAQNL